MKIPRDLRLLIAVCIIVPIVFLMTFIVLNTLFSPFLQGILSSSVILEIHKSLIELNGVLVGFSILVSTLILQQKSGKKRIEKLRFSVFLSLVSALTCYIMSIMLNILAMTMIASNNYLPNILSFSLGFTFSGILLGLSQIYSLLMFERIGRKSTLDKNTIRLFFP